MSIENHTDPDDDISQRSAWFAWGLLAGIVVLVLVLLAQGE